jgi:hypothetical protein
MDQFSKVDYSTIAILLIILIGVPIVVFFSLPYFPEGTQGMIFPIIVILGVVELVGSLIAATMVIRFLGIDCRIEALGLPRGSIRSLIALSLIIIFVMLAISMYPNLQSKVISLPSNYTTTYANGSVSSIYNSTSFVVEPSEAMKTFSTTTLTTISTLVVAIASFYFGSRAVEAAKKALGSSKETERSKITTNPSGLAYAIKESPLFVTLENVDKNTDIDNWMAYGDEEGKIEKGENNRFTYTPSVEAKKDVMLKFKATKDSNIEATLSVKVSNDKKTDDAQKAEVEAKKELDEAKKTAKDAEDAWENAKNKEAQEKEAANKAKQKADLSKVPEDITASNVAKKKADTAAEDVVTAAKKSEKANAKVTEIEAKLKDLTTKKAKK